MPEQEHLHRARVSQPGERATRAGIQLFYLRRDGVAIDGNVFAQRQRDRTDAIFSWLGKELPAGDFGLPQLSVICALDWMEFRAAYPIERAAALAPIRAAWRDRPSIAAIRPDT